MTPDETVQECRRDAQIVRERNEAIIWEHVPEPLAQALIMDYGVVIRCAYELGYAEHTGHLREGE